MDGISRLSNVARTNFYPAIDRNNFTPRENVQQEETTRQGVNENVSKFFQAAQEIGYAPISSKFFEGDDTDALGNTHGIVLNPGESRHKAIGRESSPAECETCANRKYQDGSDETDVSFQTPTHISPSIAATVVLGHEHEHVANAYEKERNGEAEVKNVTVQLKTDICPECGKVYIAGGVTHTEMAYHNENNPYEQESLSGVENFLRGALVNLNA